MMDEIMRQEERILLNQIAKLTEEGHLAWDCVEYNPIGFLDKDEYSEQSACCNLRRTAATGAFASGHPAEPNGHLH